MIDATRPDAALTPTQDAYLSLLDLDVDYIVRLIGEGQRAGYDAMTEHDLADFTGNRINPTHDRRWRIVLTAAVERGRLTRGDGKYAPDEVTP